MLPDGRGKLLQGRFGEVAPGLKSARDNPIDFDLVGEGSPGNLPSSRPGNSAERPRPSTGLPFKRAPRRFRNSRASER